MDNDVNIVEISHLRKGGIIYDCCIGNFGDSSDEEIKAPDFHSHEENINLEPKSQTTGTSINNCSSVLSSEALENADEKKI